MESELRERGGRSPRESDRSEGSFETTWRELRVGATTESPMTWLVTVDW